MSNKVWVVQNKQRYANRKFRIYHTEAELLRGIRGTDSLVVFEYDLVSSQTASDFLKARERDAQVRTVLGELEPHEENAMVLIDLFDKLVPHNPNDRYNTKNRTIEELKKIQSNKKSLAAYLVKNKNFFLKVSDSVEWLVAVLKCHNFQDCKIGKTKWNPEARRHDVIDLSTEELKQNFQLAKKELKKK